MAEAPNSDVDTGHLREATGTPSRRPRRARRWTARNGSAGRHGTNASTSAATPGRNAAAPTTAEPSGAASGAPWRWRA